ncbi:MAG: tryptophan synthase subunit beta, partial [Chitinophagaceae bacterium]|nr:tryptophan synthase subunit beta [Chitinophagaceae bacterium]
MQTGKSGQVSLGAWSVNEHGYYGDFGGAFIPEMLYPNIKLLQENYLNIIYRESFQKEFMQLLRDYVGRPTTLFFANLLSDKYTKKIFL